MEERITFDAATRRRYDENGFLHVFGCHLTKEQVAEYWGYEIPGWSELGLDAQKLYRGYRPAEELAKAAETFNGLPLLSEHMKDSAEEPQKMLRVGNLGTDAVFERPYLSNSLIIQDQAAIDALNPSQGGQPAKKELSASYRYDPVIESGVWEGQPYDFIMRNLRGNHVALVKSGRAGSDVVVADSAPSATTTVGDAMSVEGSIMENLKDVAQALVGETPVEAEVAAQEVPAPAPVVDAETCQSDADVPQEGGVDFKAKIKAYLDSMEDQEFAARVREVLAAAMGEEPLAAPTEAAAGDAEEPVVEAVVETSEEPQEEAAQDAPAPCAMDEESIASRVREQIKSQFEAAKAVRPIAGEIDPLSFDSAEAIYAHALKTAGYPTDVVDLNALKQMCVMAEKVKFAGMGYPSINEAVAADSKPEAEFPYLDNIRRA